MFDSQEKSNNLDVWDHTSEKKVMSLQLTESGFCKLSTFHKSKIAGKGAKSAKL